FFSPPLDFRFALAFLRLGHEVVIIEIGANARDGLDGSGSCPKGADAFLQRSPGLALHVAAPSVARRLPVVRPPVVACGVPIIGEIFQQRKEMLLQPSPVSGARVYGISHSG